jgi:hypothetical protein
MSARPQRDGSRVAETSLHRVLNQHRIDEAGAAQALQLAQLCGGRHRRHGKRRSTGDPLDDHELLFLGADSRPAPSS